MSTTASPRRRPRPSLGALLPLGWRFWVVVPLASVSVAVVIGVPTDVLPNPWFTRMTPVHPSDRVFWVLTSVLVGVLAATYVVRRGIARPHEARAGFGAGVLGWLAIGCPICNKLVVALLGVSGALNYFGPFQPILGIVGTTVSAIALGVRLRALGRSCPVRSPGAVPANDGLG